MKDCPRCKKTLLLETFNWKIKGKKRQVYCKKCQSEYTKEHYQNNKEIYKKRAKKRNRE